MIEPQRLLARMNTITVDWQNNIPVTGKVLTAQEISGSLAGLARGPYLLMRYLWCQDDSVAKELYGLLMVETINIAAENDWRCKNNFYRLAALMKMAVDELKENSSCKPCKGTGVMVNQPCVQCNGRGKKKRSQLEQARLCGVKPANWKNHWALKYQEIYLKISEWNDEGINHFLSRLS